MNRRIHIACLLSAALTIQMPSYAQKIVPAGNDTVQNRKGLVHELGINFRPGYIAPVNGFFDGNNAKGKPIRTALSGHLQYAFRFSPHSELGRLYPNTYQGIGVAYSSFSDKEELGTPVSVYVFQGSRIARISSRLSLDYEWNFGASFGWKTNKDAPNNNVTGSNINAYMNIGVLLNWQITPNWRLNAGVDLSHFSNGNSHYPNAGVNTLGGRIGLVRTFGNTVQDNTFPVTHTTFRKHISYDVIVYGATRIKGLNWDDHSTLVPGSFGIIGANFNPMYNFNKYFKAGVSLDAQYDESANIQEHIIDPELTGDAIKFYRPPFKEQFSMGLSLRCEFVMPIFSINFGIGRNLLSKGKDTEGFYQILALKTSVTKNLFLHVGYQLSKFKDPNNLMLGFGYRFHNKR